MSGEARPALSLAQQADFVDALLLHCTAMGGAIARETHITVTADEARDLLRLADRLRRMAPYEREIKRIVTGRN